MQSTRGVFTDGISQRNSPDEKRVQQDSPVQAVADKTERAVASPRRDRPASLLRVLSDKLLPKLVSSSDTEQKLSQLAIDGQRRARASTSTTTPRQGGSEIVQPVTPRFVAHTRTNSSPILPSSSAVGEPSLEKAPLAKQIPTCDMNEIVRTNFAILTEEKILQMTPRERRELKNELQKAQDRYLPTSGEIDMALLPSSPLSLALSKDSEEFKTERLERLTYLQQKLESISKTAKDCQLLLLIERKHPSVCEALLLCAEAVIDPSHLFQLLLEAVRTLSNKTDNSAKLLAYLEFSARWVEIHKETKLFEPVVEALKKIVKQAHEHGTSSVLKATSALENLLREPPNALSSMTITSCESDDFLAVIYKQITENKWDSESDRYVEKIATDLLFQQWQLIRTIQAHHLLNSKWKQIPPPKAQYVQFFNRLNDYFLDLILLEPVLQKRVRLVQFVLKIAQKSSELNDLSSAHSLMAIFSNADFRTLKTMMKKLPKDYEKLMASLRSVYSHENEYRALRAKLARCQGSFHIPYLGLFQADIQYAQEKVGLQPLIDNAGQQEYNFEMLYEIKAKCDQALAVNKMSYPFEQAFSSTLIPQCMAIFQPLTDNAREGRAKALEASDATNG